MLNVPYHTRCCYHAGCSLTPTSLGTTPHIPQYHTTQHATAMTTPATLQLLTLTWPVYICTQQWRPSGLNIYNSRSVMLDGLAIMQLQCKQVMYEAVALSVNVIEGCYSARHWKGMLTHALY